MNYDGWIAVYKFQSGEAYHLTAGTHYGGPIYNARNMRTGINVGYFPIDYAFTPYVMFPNSKLMKLVFE